MEVSYEDHTDRHNQSFQIVSIVSVYHVTQCKHYALANARRNIIVNLLRPGGYIMIVVINRKETNIDQYAQHGAVVDITRDTILGNPFPLSKYTRSESLALYKPWPWSGMQDNQSPIGDAIWDLAISSIEGNLCLVCCCKPLDCHGDIVKAAIEWTVSNVQWTAYDNIRNTIETSDQ